MGLEEAYAGRTERSLWEDAGPLLPTDAPRD